MIPPKGTLGGSQIAAVLGLDPWKGPLEVYAEVVGEPRATLPSKEQARGHRLEPVLLEWWREETGATLEDPPDLFRADTPTGWSLRHPAKPYLRATLDALGRRNGVRVLADAKTTNAMSARGWGEPGTDDVPMHVALQLHVYGAVTRALGWDMAPAAEVPTCLAGDFELYVVPYDPALGEMVVAAAERFNVDHVLPRRPPPASEPYSDLRAVNALYRRHDGEAKHYSSLGTEEQREVVRWVEANRARKTAERAEAEAEAAVKLVLGAAPQLLGLPEELGLRRIDWKANKTGRAIDWEAVAGDTASRANLPASDWHAIIERHTTTKEGARPLRAWEQKP